MTDHRKTINAMMSGLITGTFGCLDAAAETINARFGGGASKGTLSKRLNGQLDWSVADVVALEDASGRYPVTKILARRLRNSATIETGCLIENAGRISKESGEAVAAILAAEQSANADECAAAIKEIDEALEALRAARSALEGTS